VKTLSDQRLYIVCIAILAIGFSLFSFGLPQVEARVHYIVADTGGGSGGSGGDSTPPVITNIQTSNVSEDSVTITWTTNEPSSSQVEYGLDPSYGNETPIDWTWVTNHSVVLIGLSSNTLYHFRVRSQDDWGNLAVSDDFTLTTLMVPFTEGGGEVVMEVENYDVKAPRNGQDWEFHTAAAGFSGTGYLEALPNLGVLIETDYDTLSPELQYRINFTTTGTFYVWLRGWAISANNDSVHAGLDEPTPLSDRMGPYSNYWDWRRSTFDAAPSTVEVTTPGVHTFYLWMREDGLKVDKILLRIDPSSTPPSGLGPGESPRGEAPPNNPPQVTALTPLPGVRFYEEDLVTIEVTATDPDGHALEYQYMINAVIVQPWTLSSTYDLQSSDKTFGEKTVEVEVRDGYGGTDTAQTQIFFMKGPLAP